jgi:tetratricopeptide (TPR) repeat protein
MRTGTCRWSPQRTPRQQHSAQHTTTQQHELTPNQNQPLHLQNAILAFGAAATFEPSVSSSWYNLAVALEAEVGTPQWNSEYSNKQKAANRDRVVVALSKAIELDPTRDAASPPIDLKRLRAELDAKAAKADRAAAIAAEGGGESKAAEGGGQGEAEAEAAYQLAIQLDEAGDVAGAVIAFREVTEHQPASAPAWHNYCMALADEGNPAAGKEHNTAALKEACGRAVELSPDNGDAKEELQRAEL